MLKVFRILDPVEILDAEESATALPCDALPTLRSSERWSDALTCLLLRLATTQLDCLAESCESRNMARCHDPSFQPSHG